MPPKMLTRMALTFGSARIRRIANVTLSARAPPPMSRKFAGSPPARFTRSMVVIARPAPLTMQPIVPSSLMKLMPAFAGLEVRRVLLVEVAQRLELRVAGEGRIVQRDLGVEADQPLHGRPVGARLANDRQRVDLDEIGVVGEHRPTRPLAIPTAAFRWAPRPMRERQLRACQSSRPEVADRRGSSDDRGRVGRRDLLDLDAALGRAHQQDPPGRAVEDRRQVELLDDVRGRARPGPCGR